MVASSQMKGLPIIAVVGGVALVGVGVAMAVSNPTQAVYEDYATQQMISYGQENICPKAPTFLGNSLQGQCSSLLNSHQPEIKQIISQSTQRQNYILFSLYQTDFSISTLVPFLPANVLPSYHFQAVGVFGNFYVYQSQKR